MRRHINPFFKSILFKLTAAVVYAYFVVFYFVSTVIIYTAEIRTSNVRAKHTPDSLAIYLQMFGSYGDTGRRLMYRSTNSELAFRPGQLDMFEIEAVYLGTLERLELSVSPAHEGEDILY